VLRFATETLTILIGPLMPHLAEEMWQTLGHKTLIADTLWPVAAQEMLVDDKVTIAVQVNGKLRGTLNIAKDSDKETIEQAALMLEGVQTFIEGKDVRKIIVVPNKIVNVVI
jgi:leucyl-tRNA synthetase